MSLGFRLYLKRGILVSVCEDLVTRLVTGPVFLDMPCNTVKCVSTLDLGVAPASCNAIYGCRQGAGQSVRILCRVSTVLRSMCHRAWSYLLAYRAILAAGILLLLTDRSPTARFEAYSRGVEKSVTSVVVSNGFG
jgi:hypothetical protein